MSSRFSERSTRLMMYQRVDPSILMCNGMMSYFGLLNVVFSFCIRECRVVVTRGRRRASNQDPGVSSQRMDTQMPEFWAFRPLSSLPAFVLFRSRASLKRLFSSFLLTSILQTGASRPFITTHALRPLLSSFLDSNMATDGPSEMIWTSLQPLIHVKVDSYRDVPLAGRGASPFSSFSSSNLSTDDPFRTNEYCRQHI